MRPAVNMETTVRRTAPNYLGGGCDSRSARTKLNYRGSMCYALEQSEKKRGPGGTSLIVDPARDVLAMEALCMANASRGVLFCRLLHGIQCSQALCFSRNTHGPKENSHQRSRSAADPELLLERSTRRVINLAVLRIRFPRAPVSAGWRGVQGVSGSRRHPATVLAKASCFACTATGLSRSDACLGPCSRG